MEIYFSSQSPIPSETILSEDDTWSPKNENGLNDFEGNIPFDEYPRPNISKVKMIPNKCGERGPEVRMVFWLINIK